MAPNQTEMISIVKKITKPNKAIFLLFTPNLYVAIATRQILIMPIILVVLLSVGKTDCLIGIIALPINIAKAKIKFLLLIYYIIIFCYKNSCL